jgi:hypothetical protein
MWPPVTSGDIFELKIDNPEIRPLPSFQILEMQWFLQRVLGMAGAAEVDEDLLDEDEDDISDIHLNNGG